MKKNTKNQSKAIAKKVQKKAVIKAKSASKNQPKLVAKNPESLMPKVVPLGSRVLIKPFMKGELEKKNSFGIIIPETDLKEKSEQGKVLAVGPGEMRDGKLVPVGVEVGDIVAYSRYGFEDLKVDGEELYLIKEENILAILK